MKWFKRAESAAKLAEQGKKTAETLEKQRTCKHQGKFYCYGSNTLGMATCLDCGDQIGLDWAMNVYFEKMDKLLGQ